jgi:hypothetical protein
MSDEQTQDLKARIAAASSRKSESYTLADTDIEVELRSMTVGQRSRFKDIARIDKDGAMQGKLDAIQFFIIRECVYDPNSGRPLFKESDLAAVQEMSPAIIDPLVKKCMDISGLSKEAVAAAKNE